MVQFDRGKHISASLLQVRREYFGAYTYERTDQPRATFFHLDGSNPDRLQQQIGTSSEVDRRPNGKRGDVCLTSSL